MACVAFIKAPPSGGLLVFIMFSGNRDKPKNWSSDVKDNKGISYNAELSEEEDEEDNISEDGENDDPAEVEHDVETQMTRSFIFFFL